MKVVCTICARAGSQGVKNKNLMDLNGKPLVAYTILQAQKSKIFDAIIVSSDSDQILEIAKSYGVKYCIKRPHKLANSVSAKLPAIRHALTEVEKLLNEKFDIIADLDVTAPLRTVDDICNSFDLFRNDKSATNLVTGARSRKSPYFNLAEEQSDGYVRLAKPPEKPIYRRQDAPRCFDMNGSVYIWHRNTLFEGDKVILDKTLVYEMPEERSIDIDLPVDLELVRILIKDRVDLQ